METLKLDVEGVSISSMFHYFYLEKNIEKIKSDFFSEGNTDFITNYNDKFFENRLSVDELKKFLKDNNIHCR